MEALKKRLLVITNCDPLDHLGSGYVINRFVSILTSNIDVVLYSPKDFKGIRILKQRAIFYQASWSMFKLVRKHVKNKKTDAILFFGGEAWLSALYLKWFARHIKRLHHSNGIEPVYAPASAFFNGGNKLGYQLIGWLSRWSFSNMHGIVLHNLNDKYWLEKYLNIDNSHLQYLPIPLADSMIGLTKKPIKERGKKIGFCGMWIPRKGTDILASVMNKVLKQFPDWELYLIGQSNGFSKEPYFDESICHQITVLPNVPTKEEMASVLSEMRIMFLPSRQESFGLVFTEALACGCVLLSKKTGFNYSIQNNEAVIIDKDDADKYGEALINLMQNEEHCQMISDNGYALVQQLNWKNVQQQYLAFIKTTIVGSTQVYPLNAISAS